MFVRSILLAGAVALATPALAAPMTGAEFAHKAASTDVFEIESSKLALAKSSNPKVKDFANMMIKDHNTSSANLMTAAKKASVPIDKSLDPMKADTLARMKSMSGGPAWDKAYLDAQTKGHQMALATMKDYAANGSVPSLKTFAANTSKVVAGHLDHVKMLDGMK